MKLIFDSINITGTIIDAIASITITTSYTNKYDCPLETNYNFCLDTEAVIDSLTTQIGNKTIHGIVKEKSIAKTEYNIAITNNKKASLLEKNNDIYSVKLGNIAPKETIIITYTYLTHLSMNINGHYVFVFPTNIGERYGLFCNHPYLSPMKNNNNLEHHMNFNLVCKSNCKINKIYSLTTPIMHTIDSDFQQTIDIISFPKGGDVNLFIDTDIKTNLYKAITEVETYYMITHKINGKSQLATNIDNDELQLTSIDNKLPLTTNHKEYIFILDRSGSMDGEKMKNANNALIKSLNLIDDDKSYFNVISFGNLYSCMFDNSVLATKINIAKAVIIIEQYRANMGGTEIYGCLNYCFNKNTNTNNNITNNNITNDNITNDNITNNNITTNNITNNEKIIIFLTDGQVNNTQPIYDLIKRQQNTRIFTIGIGKDASRELIETMSNLLCGISMMVIDAIDIESVTSFMMQSAKKQYYTNLTIKINDENINFIGDKIIYPEQYAKIFFKLKNDTQFDKIILNGFYDNNNKIQQWIILNDDTTNTNIFKNENNILEKMYANQQIKYGNLTNDEIIKQSVKYNIMNTLTSFIMVEEINTKENRNNCNSNGNNNNNNNDDGYNDYEDCNNYYNNINVESVDALEGGMSMFGSNQVMTKIYDYKIFDSFSTNKQYLELNNVNLTKITTMTETQIDTYCLKHNIDKLILFNILTYMYIDKINDINGIFSRERNMIIKNHIEWLTSNMKNWKKYINDLKEFVKNPFTITYSEGDY